VLWELGADRHPVGVEPDGFNINKRLRLDRARASLRPGVATRRRSRHRAGWRRRPPADLPTSAARSIDGDQILA
jgi:hypothetical protein